MKTSPYETEALETCLRAFSDLVASQDEIQRAQLGDDWAWQYSGGKSNFHLVVSVMIHGDEVGPLEGLLDVMEAIQSGKLQYDGLITCVVGNPEAGRRVKRFIDVDLNRVFDSELRARQPEELHYEEARAQSLMRLFDQCDLLIDFHQTILDSAQPFYICPWSEETWRWMRLMGGAKVWVTRHPHRGGGGLLCADEYVRQRGKPAVALELGALGFTSKARAGVWKSLSMAIKAINEISQKTATLSELANAEPDLKFYETSYRARFDNPLLTLKEGLVNFTEVQCEERLSPLGSDLDHLPDISAPQSGVILFPKYPPRDEGGEVIEPRPRELYRIISPLSSHPLELWTDKSTDQ